MEKLYGNAVVGQSGGPTAAINATLSGVIRGALAAIEKGSIGKLYGMRNGIEGFCEERLVDLGKIFTTEQRLRDLERTPAAALGSCRKRLPDPAENPVPFEFIVDLFRKYDIRYFFYIGGNDSMDTVKKLRDYTESIGYEMRLIGVPKTIDNAHPPHAGRRLGGKPRRHLAQGDPLRLRGLHDQGGHDHRDHGARRGLADGCRLIAPPVGRHRPRLCLPPRAGV